MEEKKQYSIVGRVEIGTDEYRDLIESRMQQENRADGYMRDGWKKDEEIKDLKKQVEVLRGKIEKCEKFIKKNTVNISEDGISTFIVNLFEEE